MSDGSVHKELELYDACALVKTTKIFVYGVTAKGNGWKKCIEK